MTESSSVDTGPSANEPTEPTKSTEPSEPTEAPERTELTDAAAPERGSSAPDGEWRRVSRLTPLLRGGLVFVAVLGYLGSQLLSYVVGLIGGGQSKNPGEDEGLSAALAHPLIAVGILLAVIALVVAAAYLSWRFTRYRISDVQVELRKGWLNREHRQVPLNRIQAVEISRPLLAQLLGLAQVVVQSAGGNDSHLKLAFLSLADANAVRHRLQRLAAQSDEAGLDRGGESHAAGAGPADGGPADRGPAEPGPANLALPGELFGFGSAEGRPILKVPNLRLVVATMLHGSVFGLAVLVLLTAVGASVAARYGAVAGLVAGLPAIAPVVFGIVVNRISEITKHGNFALSDVGGAVRVVHGLTDHRTTSIPFHRIQAMEMIQPLWWRPMGWWRVRLNVAGLQHEAGETTSEDAVLPVGPLRDALEVLALIDPHLDVEELGRASTGVGDLGGWIGSPERARIFDPWSWRRNGFSVSRHAVLIRGGRFSRRVTVVPHARIQSMTLTQGPFAGRRRLADVLLISTPGPVTPRIPHLDVEVAERFHWAQMARARRARRSVDAVAKSAQLAVNLGEGRSARLDRSVTPDLKEGPE